MAAKAVIALARHREILENGGFSPHLQLVYSKETVRITADGWTEVQYTVPASLCSASSYHQRSGAGSVAANGGACLPLCTVLALFDDISTYSIILADRTQRPGASLSLDGEEVVLRTQATKVGKVIGFADCQVVRVTANKPEVVVEGRHVKYLPMGVLWDCAFRWMSLETVLGLVARVRGSATTTAGSSEHGVDGDCSNLFPVPIVFDGAVGDGGGGADKTTTQVRGSVVSGKQHANPFGAAHGGWVACVLEAVARAAVEQHPAMATQPSHPPAVVELLQSSVSYMAPAPAVAVASATCARIRGASHVMHNDGCILLAVTATLQGQPQGSGRPRTAATASMLWAVRTLTPSAHM